MSENTGKKCCYGELWSSCETNDRNVSAKKKQATRKESLGAGAMFM